jgi:predicted RNase H-like HicB family nuclease
MMTEFRCNIEAFWDSEAEVWVATSEDVPGLVTEAETIELLTSKLRVMIPELIFANEIVPIDYKGSINFQLTSHRQELIEVAS